jgi:hypothetical protein
MSRRRDGCGRPVLLLEGKKAMTSSDVSAPRRLWLAAGGLALSHIVLMLAGFVGTPVSRLGDSPAAALATYRGSSPVGAGIGSAVSVLGFLALLLAVPLFARLLREDSESGRWLAAVITLSGALYVGLTLALPFAASSAARYDAQHGTPAETVLAISNLQWFGGFLATVLLGVFTLAVAAAAWRTRRLPRWVAGAGVVPGVCCVAAAAMPPENLVDDVTLVWMVWFVLFAVTALRAGRVRSRSLSEPVAA